MNVNHIILALFPLIALIALGYLFKKYNFLSEGFWSGAEKLNYYVLFPTLLFHSLSKAQINLQHLNHTIFVMCLVVIAITIGLYIIRIFRHIPSARFGVHVQSLVRFNTYIGLALVTTLFGHTGQAILAILLAFCIPLVNIISVFALTPKDQMAIRPVLFALFKNPLILACLLGGVFNTLEIPLWIGFDGLIKLLSASSLPLGLLCVGAALQFIQIKQDIVIVIINTLARLLIVPAISYGLSLYFGLSTLAMQVLVIFMALPTAPTSYILTKALGGDSQLMAAVISFQTLCAVLTLPIVIWWMH